MNELVALKVLDIYLDPLNPRHEELSTQEQIISHLVKKEKVKNLAKDIARNGTSPIELLAVIREKTGQYTAVEGNRRLCALTLLNDPSRAPGHKEIESFKKISDENKENIPKKINCIIFKNRKDADLWIERRHKGAQDGVGAREWDSQQKTRHNVRKSNPDTNSLAAGLIDYAVASGFISKENKEKILTTASRYLGNPHFRSTLGIVSGRSDSEIVINVTFEEFDRVISRFCKDLTNKQSGVNSRTNRADWEAYAEKLVTQGIAPTQKVEKRKLSDKSKYPKDAKPNPTGKPLIDGGPSPITDAPTPTRGTKNPNKRMYIVPSGFNPSISDKIIRRVMGEMKAVCIDDYPLAVSLLTRAFLENLYSQFHETKASYITAETHVVLGKVIAIIEKDTSITTKEKKALGALKRVQSNTNNVLNPKTLGANAHASHYPNPTELKTEWDNISAILEYMLRQL